MTFDEAIEKAKKDLVYDDNACGVWTELLEDLKHEYAPTIEMTKEQYKIFNRDIQLNQKTLDDYIDEPMGLPKITNRQLLNLYTHPETIHVIEED